MIKKVRGKGFLESFFPTNDSLKHYFRFFELSENIRTTISKSEKVTQESLCPGLFYYMPFEDITNELPVRWLTLLKLRENSFLIYSVIFYSTRYIKARCLRISHLGIQIFQLKYSWFKYKFLTAEMESRNFSLFNPCATGRFFWWRILWVLSYEKLRWVGVTLVAVTHPA